MSVTERISNFAKNTVGLFIPTVSRGRTKTWRVFNTQFQARNRCLLQKRFKVGRTLADRENAGSSKAAVLIVIVLLILNNQFISFPLYFFDELMFENHLQI